MKRSTILLISSIFLTPLIAHAKVIKANTEANNIIFPQRNQTMKSVLTHYGKATQISHSRGKVTKKWPQITRWKYPHFTVYFEKHLVLHTVID